MTQQPPMRQIDNWQDAERNAADWMRYWGHSDAVATPGGSDGGIDVRASDAYGQVKFTAAQVGRPELNRLVGAAIHSGRELFFFTGSGYAAPAVAYADKANIALFVYDPWGRMTPVNQTARVVVSVAEDIHRVANRPAQDGFAGAAPVHTPTVHQSPALPPKRKTGRWALVLAVICFYLPINWFFADPGYDHPWYQNVLAVTIAITLGFVFLRIRRAIRGRRN